MKQYALNYVPASSVRRATANLPEHADVCLLNGGSIRADLPAGNVTLDQITKILPFGNSLVLVKVTGADVSDPRVGWGSGEGGGNGRGDGSMGRPASKRLGVCETACGC